MNWQKNSDWEISQSPIPSALNINDTIFTHLKKEDTKKPSKKLKNSEWGIRISKTMSKVEYSFSYLYTWDDNPVAQKYFNVDSPPYLNIIIEPVHKRQHIWGVDFNTFLGELGIMGEAVFLYKFFQTQDMSKQGALVKKPYLFYLVGADHSLFNDLSFSFLEDIYINLQFGQQIIFKYNELIEEEKNRNFLTLRLSNKYFFNTLEIDLTFRSLKKCLLFFS